jgi:hypothetical protein
MGYGLQFSANKLGGWLKLWGIRNYGLSGVWVKRISTVLKECSVVGDWEESIESIDDATTLIMGHTNLIK